MDNRIQNCRYNTIMFNDTKILEIIHLKTTFTPLSYQSHDFIKLQIYDHHTILTFELYHAGIYSTLIHVWLHLMKENLKKKVNYPCTK